MILVKWVFGGLFLVSGIGQLAAARPDIGVWLLLIGGWLCYSAWQSSQAPGALVQGRKSSGGNMLCSRCGTLGVPVKPLRGSGWITLVLLLCFLAPGLIYMIWRRTGPLVCAACGSDAIIPPDSPGAAAVIRHETHVKCPECRELVVHDARRCRHCGCALTPQ